MKRLKIIIIGESNVGKSSLISQYIDKNFKLEYMSTIANDRRIKKLIINDKEITIEIWDTVGQEKLRNINKMFLKNSQIAIFVYDITNKKSIEHFESYWYKEVCDTNDPNKIIFGIVANKIDLYNKQEIEPSEGIKLAETIGAKFYETSANNYDSIEIVFEELVENYINKFANFDSDDNCNKSYILDNISAKKDKSNCCKIKR